MVSLAVVFYQPQSFFSSRFFSTSRSLFTVASSPQLCFTFSAAFQLPLFAFLPAAVALPPASSSGVTVCPVLCFLLGCTLWLLVLLLRFSRFRLFAARPAVLASASPVLAFAASCRQLLFPLASCFAGSSLVRFSSACFFVPEHNRSSQAAQATAIQPAVSSCAAIGARA